MIDDTIRGTLDPGGILNSGFAVAWAKDRQHDAKPAPGGGQSWATDRIKAGDKTCLANQALHSQAPDVIQTIKTQRYWTDAIGLPLSPEHFVNKINVPVYLAGDWQDEQTGGYFANLLGQFTGTKEAWFTAQNGSHTDPFDPTVFARWVQFLSIFVAQKVPHQTALTALVASTVANMAFGTTAPLPPDPFANVTTYAQAKQTVREVPAGAHPVRERRRLRPGRARAALRGRLSVVAGARAPPTPWYFGADGSLVDAAPSASGADSYVYDPSHQHDTTIAGGEPDRDVGASCPTFQWNAPAAGNRARVRDRAARPRRDGDRRTRASTCG